MSKSKLYAGQRKVANDVEKRLLKEQYLTKHNKKKSELKKNLYYQRLIKLNEKNHNGQ